jgi:superfamily I DNA and/or RNA helicase
MHPALGEFVSRNFYQGDLKSKLAPEIFKHNLDRYRMNGREKVAAWIDVPESRGLERSAGSKSRPPEALRLMEEVEQIGKENPDLSIGIISFYSAQVRALDSELHHFREQGRIHTRAPILVGTVDSFQGREFDVVLLSMTRSNRFPRMADYHRATARERELSARRRYGFLSLTNRANVSLSRQKRLLIVVGDQQMVTDYEEAADAIGPLCNFHKLCQGEYGICF